MDVKKKVLGIVLGLMVAIPAMSQFTYGTTGLLNMPTADMQKDKTVMLGGGRLNKYATPYRWNYDTWNYYMNITFFPWLEVSYTCTVFDEMRGTVHMINQDRNFAARLRVWKEGWWKAWTPQLVVGVNDVTTGGEKDYTDLGVGGSGNGFYSRSFIAMTKHFCLPRLGELGAHVSYLHNERTDYRLDGVAAGVNFRFAVPIEVLWAQALNGLNLMAEAYPANGQGAMKLLSTSGEKRYKRGLSVGKYDINVGGCYSLWKDHINLYGHWYGCKDFSAGLEFKIGL